MNEQTNNLEKLLDPTANKALQELSASLRLALLTEAQKISGGDTITEGELELAFKRLRYPSEDSLKFADAQTVISQAFKENRIAEWISYLMAVILFTFGIVLISIGMVLSDVSTKVSCLIAGSVVELLILIPFRFAVHSRRHNMAMRMLGLILNRVDDPKKLAPLLKDTFLSVVLGQARFEVRNKK